MEKYDEITRVGFLLPWLKKGGTEIAMVRIMNQLAEDPGLQVFLVVHAECGECSLNIDPRIEISYIGGFLLFGRRRYRKWLSRVKPAAVFSAINSMNILNASCSNFVRAVPTIHNHMGEKLKRKAVFGERRLKEGVLRYFLSKCDTVISVSEGISEYLRESIGLSAEKLQCIPPPIPVSEIREKAMEPVNLPFTNGRRLIVASGRMTEQKGFDVLLHALSLESKASRPALLLMGDGDLLERHRKLALDLELEGDVVFCGRQENPFPYVRLADCFVLSSRWEGFPLVILEALTLGKTIVANDCPSGPREILKNGQFGYLAKVDCPRSLLSCIRKALKEPIDIGPLMKRAEEFDVELVGEQYKRLVFER